jgi:hypothetical protein
MNSSSLGRMGMFVVPDAITITQVQKEMVVRLEIFDFSLKSFMNP